MLPVIVFISSVRRGLEDERDYLPGLVSALGHNPRRFEDFTAQPTPSREACLAGVAVADVYLLLLGDKYGDPLPDTGMAPTEEEFTAAKARGLTVIVYRKSGGTPEPRQQEFIDRVGAYATGRFWNEFTSPADLGPKVVAALVAAASAPTALVWQPVQAQPVRWRVERSQFSDRNAARRSPVLEAHLHPLTGAALPVSGLAPLAQRLASLVRERGLVPHEVGLTVDSDADAAWAVTDERHGRGGAWNDTPGGYAGIAVGRDGSVLAFTSLQSDMFGSLVDDQWLRQALGRLLRTAVEALPAGQTDVVPAAALDPTDGVSLGDPASIGERRSAGMRMGSSQTVRSAADAAVPVSSLPAGVDDIAGELAAQLVVGVRGLR